MCIYMHDKFKMSAQQELLKNLMERAGLKKSRKRARDTVYQEESIYVPCPNTKMRSESSSTDSPSSEEKSPKQVVKSY